MSSARGAAEGLPAEGGSLAQQAARVTSAAVARSAASGDAADSDLFARSVRDYARQHAGEPVKLLQAGCSGTLDELGLDALRARCFEFEVRSIDEDHPLTRKIAQASAARGVPPPVLRDLRTTPLPPRSFGVIYCAHLLDRIHHGELVLDRLVAALRPGGLLLLRFRDRESAAARLDRMLPLIARRAVWHWLRPQQAGPFPAVYEDLLTQQGVQAYVLARGLVIAQRQAVRTRPRRPARLAWGAPLACRMIERLSRGKLPDDHDDLLFVIRNPESGFARLL